LQCCRGGRAMTRATSHSERAPLDGWTVAAIAVVVYILSNLAHEGAGHGGACLLAGGRAEMLNAVFFECDDAGMSAAGVRWLAAAGTLANLLLAALVWIALRSRERLSPDVRFAFVLLLAVNLLQAFGYLLFSGIGRVGDWAAVFDGLQPEWVWRTGLSLLGGWLYFLGAPRLFMPHLEPFLGREQPAREERARRLTLLPYLAGGLAYLLAGVLNPHGWKLVLISAAAASLGGTSLLAWYPPLWAKKRGGIGAGEALSIRRSVAWLVAAVIALGLFVFILGPGINFGAPRAAPGGR
jgi:hypothetical protein